MNEYLVTCKCVLTITAENEEDARNLAENSPEMSDYMVVDEIYECVENDE